MAGSASRRLTEKDRSILRGFSDITRPEPDQIFAAEYEEPLLEEPKTPAEKLLPVREKASLLSTRINDLKEKVDKKCAHLSISTGEPVGSNLFQAMWRLFGKETTDITYEDYKQAVIKRQKLAEEDRAAKEKNERERRFQDGPKPGDIYKLGSA